MIAGAVTTDPAAAVARLARAERVLVTSHRSPDGDAIGSELAIAALARARGAEATVVNRDGPPRGLDQIPGADEIVLLDALPEDASERFDLAVVMECPGLDRPGLDGLDRLPILNIDHHKGNEAYGEVNYLDDASPAVGEMVLLMYQHAGVAVTPDVATAIYTALVTDTGDFRFPNATERAFRAAADLVAAGAEPATVAEWVHHRRSAASIRLLGEGLRTLEVRADGRLAVFHVDPEAFARAGASAVDTDDLINIPRRIAGVEIVAFLKQSQPGRTRVSLRSKDQLDVRSVAAAYGGGGHTNASGFGIDADVVRARAEVVTRLEALLGEAS